MNRIDEQISEMVRHRVDAAPPPPSVATVQRYADRLGVVELVDRSNRSTSARRLLLMAASLLVVVALGAAVLSNAGGSANDVRPSATTAAPTPTTETTPAETTTSANTGDPAMPLVQLDPDGITIAAGAIFGFVPGRGTGPDEVLPVVNDRLGPPDHDTGWIDVNTVYIPCAGLTNYREIWWGDLSMGFWGLGSGTYFHFWNVGDRELMMFILPEVDVPSPTRTTGLSTEHGISIGDLIGDVVDLPNAVSNDLPTQNQDASLITNVVSTVPGADPASINPTSRSGSYLSDDGEVIAFGGESLTC